LGANLSITDEREREKKAMVKLKCKQSSTHFIIEYYLSEAAVVKTVVLSTC